MIRGECARLLSPASSTPSNTAGAASDSEISVGSPLLVDRVARSHSAAPASHMSPRSCDSSLCAEPVESPEATGCTMVSYQLSPHEGRVCDECDSDASGASCDQLAAQAATSTCTSHHLHLSPSSTSSSTTTTSSVADVLSATTSRQSLPAKAGRDGVRSFSMVDILNHRSSRRKCALPTRIVRPWTVQHPATSPEQSPPLSLMQVSSPDMLAATARVSLPQSGVRSAHHVRNERKRPSTGDSLNNPLDELFRMTNKTLQDFRDEKNDESSLFSARSGASKKKRKSRTAFTNHQIFELEKRFLYQKYLSPADRDEIALSLGLSNAQVITWFQNRRAKLKRDMEELKRDMENTRTMPMTAAAAAAAMLPHHKLLMTSLGIPIRLDEPQDLSTKL